MRIESVCDTMKKHSIWERVFAKNKKEKENFLYVGNDNFNRR